MPTIEERVALVEGQMSGQSHVLVELRDAVRHLDRKMDARFEAVDIRFGQTDHRFDRLERRIDNIDDKLGRYFMWVVGTQVTTLVAVVGTLLARS